jgi:drug/metabolite transporter (DMT)-like permease
MNRPLWLAAAPAIFLLLWSAGFAIAKVGLEHTGPMTLLALRYGLVLVILVPVAAILRPPMPSTRQGWIHQAVIGFLIQFAYFALCYIAFKAGISAAGLAIIVCLQPILVALAAPYLVGETVNRRAWAGLALGLVGAVTVILARSEIAGVSAGGLIAAICALFGIAGGTLYEKRFGVSQHPVTSNLIQYAVGAACTIPLALLTEDYAVDWNIEIGWVLAYLVIGNSLLAMSLLLAMIRAGEVSRVSALFYLVPAFAALWAIPLLGETMPPLAWAGLVIAGIGVAIVRSKDV